jgi:hypothetical protein
MFKPIMSSLILIAGAALTVSAMAADADPTEHQIYEAAESGHLTQARAMIQQVLRDHPRSGQAHFVAAELDARAGDFAAARSELSTAETLAPGLPFEKPAAVEALRSELSRVPRTGYAPNGYSYAPAAARARSLPWGLILAVLAGVVIIWTIVSRRRAAAYASYQQYPHPGGLPAPMGGGVPPMPGPGYGAPGYGPGYGGPVMGGGGSGLLGTLASGAAVGAGVVAGEELMRHVLEPGRAEAAVPREEVENRPLDPGNDNMGGDDFGASQPGSSWDDNGGGGDWGGGGGDSGGDWS